MELNEAKEILNKNGFILEGSMSLEDKIEHAQDFNVDNRIENSSGFGTSIKNVYGKTIFGSVKEKST